MAYTYIQQTLGNNILVVSLMLRLYLNFLLQQALLNPRQELEPYTEAMAAEDEELMAGVEVEDE